MANPKKRVPENVPGDFFVDSTCIDCDTCRQIAPAVFGGGRRHVLRQGPAQTPAPTDGRRCRRCLPAPPGPSAASATTT